MVNMLVVIMSGVQRFSRPPQVLPLQESKHAEGRVRSVATARIDMELMPSLTVSGYHDRVS